MFVLQNSRTERRNLWFQTNCFATGYFKRGFSLDLTHYGGRYMGNASLYGASLHPIGDGVGLRFTKPFGVDQSIPIARGEVFQIPDRLWAWLDLIENNGHCYTRKVVTVVVHDPVEEDEGVEAWVYEHSYPGMNYATPIESGIYEKRH